jgi:hypothetical protein
VGVQGTQDMSDFSVSLGEVMMRPRRTIPDNSILPSRTSLPIPTVICVKDVRSARVDEGRDP